MSDKVREFNEWYKREMERLQSVYFAAQDKALALRDEESEREAAETYKALLKHISLEGIEPPEGWFFVRPNKRSN